MSDLDILIDGYFMFPCGTPFNTLFTYKRNKKSKYLLQGTFW